MKGKELIKWIEENNLVESDVYVDVQSEYRHVKYAWESECVCKDGSIGTATMLEVETDAEN